MRFSVRSIALTAALCLLGGLPAMAQIAPGVTQSAAHTANINGTVRSSTGAPVPGADIRLSGTSVRSTKTDARGSFSFQSVPWGTYDITVTSSLGTATRGDVKLNGDVNLVIAYEAPSQLRTIAHVSTSSAGAHINVTSSSIASVNPSEYAFQGNGTWRSLFAQLPGVTASGYAANGGAYGNAVYGSPAAPVALSLNGALPYETSTTIDGMPLQGVSENLVFANAGGGIDLSSLPLNAFDTADVVRGPGANAPSIVDSIGGAFVLHGPGSVQRDHFEYSASNDPYGGIISNAKLGLRLGRLSTTFIYGINDSPGPLGSTDIIPADPYTPLTINGQPVTGAVGSETNPPGVPNCFCQIQTSLLMCCIPWSTAWTSHNGAADIAYNIGRSVVAEVFYAGARSQAAPQYGGYWPVAFNPAATSPAYRGSMTPTPPGEYSDRYQLVFTNYLESQASSLLEEKVTAFIGNGVLRLAALQHNSFLSLTTPDGSPYNGAYTLWGTADVAGTPTAFNGTSAQLTFFEAGEQEVNASNNRDLLASYALQISPDMSVGLSQTDSYYNLPWSYVATLGGKTVGTLGNTSAVSATTGETRVHLHFSPSDALSLGLSWYLTRSDYHVPLASNANEYADKLFSYSAPRFGAVWRPSMNVAVRLAVGGGYALPYLYNMIGTPPQFAIVSYSENKANFNLQPEKAFGFDIGTDVRLGYFTVVSLDAYRTNLYGQFYTGTSVSTLNSFPLFISQYGNLANTRYEGINLTAAHTVPSGWYWRGTLGLTRAYVINVPPGFYNGTGCTNCQNQTVIPGPNFNASYTAAVPYSSASAVLGYKWRKDTYFDLSSTYYGNNNLYNQAAFIALDAHASYAITPHVSLLATFHNITGIYDQSIQNFIPGYAYPTISGAQGYWQGAAFEVPYGPRAILLTADFRY